MASASRSFKAHQDHIARLLKYEENETDGSNQDDINLSNLTIIASLGTNDSSCNTVTVEHEIKKGEEPETKIAPLLRSNLSGTSCSQQQSFADSSTSESNDVLGHVIIGDINMSQSPLENGTQHCHAGPGMPEKQQCEGGQGETQEQIPQPQLPLATGMLRESCASGSQLPTRQGSSKPQLTSDLFVEDGKDGVMEIFVDDLTGKHDVYRVSGTDLVGALMRQIEEKTGLEESYQKLSYCGKPLQKDRSLNYYDIKKRTTVFLGMRVLGGHSLSTPVWI